MTEYSVHIGRLAERDIFEAVAYIKEILFQPESARRIYNSIKTQILSLSEMPQRFAVIAEESQTHKLCGDKFSRLSA